MERKDKSEEFRALVKSRHLTLKPPSSGQRARHVDFVMVGINKEKTSYSVALDLKYRQTKGSDKWQWIEFKNLQGQPGWIYQDADFVVFERKMDFLFVNRKNLVIWVNESNKIRHDLPQVKNSWEAKYRLYSRPDKREAITQVATRDLLEINGTQIWNKPDSKPDSKPDNKPNNEQ
tara:strand:- start:399 stop:926 length:528 start_codon:yes stop_codon:yes gene_type:complete